MDFHLSSCNWYDPFCLLLLFIMVLVNLQNVVCVKSCACLKWDCLIYDTQYIFIEQLVQLELLKDKSPKTLPIDHMQWGGAPC